jgi:hypothetical protein
MGSWLSSWHSTMGMRNMNLADEKYTKIISAFDNWHDYKSISITLRRVGLECNESQSEYHAAIQLLEYAKGTYPNIPLHEAYKKQLVAGVKPLVAINFTQVTNPEPIGVGNSHGCCGGGKVR